MVLQIRTYLRLLFAITHVIGCTMMEFSQRERLGDPISIIETGEQIQFTSVYRQNFLAGRSPLMAG